MSKYWGPLGFGLTHAFQINNIIEYDVDIDFME